MNRVLVVGCSGVGKSTFAAQVAEQIGLPFVHTDPMYWGPNWNFVPDDVVVERVKERVREARWVMDGNFVDHRALVWRRADTVIWLDLPFSNVLFRIVRRNVGWWLKRQRGWTDQPMPFRRAWSGIRHSVRSHGVKRKTYPMYLEEFPHLRVVRLRAPGEVRSWLESLAVI